ncbi:MAG TPA: LssY C-terminal domain-containing protein [Candidatus Saccharimonadales bacterium]|nr:LssY C-terminal domain-containing protein [Candidatus Saccharimonadales bacterium]
MRKTMIQYIGRQAKRFVVLLPGIIIVYFSVRNVFPVIDSHLPDSVSIFITYVLVAYIFIPAAIRLVRILFPPKHLPLYCVTPDGFASDPLNIGIIGTRRQLISAMEKAGWHMADPHSPRNVARLVASTALHRIYKNAPVSSLYLFGRKQDVAFEIPIPGIGSRHHVRFWATTYHNKGRLSIQGIHWQHRRAHIQGDNLLWVGAASLDVGLNVIRHNLQVTHMIHPDTDQERELILKQLRKESLVAKVQTLILGDPYQLINRVWRGYLQTDGKMAVISLKNSQANFKR